MAKRAPSMKVVDSVKRELTQIRRVDRTVASSGMAATALALARELDSPKNSATSKSMCARALTETLTRLREQLPEPASADKLDDLEARRRKRLAKGA